MSPPQSQPIQYTAESIRSLNWRDHIRLRPGMYIGTLGNGSQPDDGIYILLKEIIDNSIDEHIMGHGKKVEVNVSDSEVTVRDYGRGIPLEKVIDCVAQINTGGKYDNKAFRKSVGLNGVGMKAVNALSAHFQVRAYRNGKCKTVTFAQGKLRTNDQPIASQEPDGTQVTFRPDTTIFPDFAFSLAHIQEQISYYTFLNRGLKIVLNSTVHTSKRGLWDLLAKKTAQERPLYPTIHLLGQDIEIALTHCTTPQEHHYTFVNGQHTPQGGTHLAAWKEAIVKTLRHFYKKNFHASDIRSNLVSAISIRIDEPVFESQTKTKLGSQHIAKGGVPYVCSSKTSSANN